MGTDHEPEQETQDDLDDEVFIENLEVKDKFDEKLVLVEDKKKGVMPITSVEKKNGKFVIECKLEAEDFKNRFGSIFIQDLVGRELALLPNWWFKALRGDQVLGARKVRKKNTSSSQDKPTNVKKKSPKDGKIPLEEFKEMGKEK